MVTLPGCPFTVFFRPDVDGLRDEVVVELGKMWSGTPAHVTTPYTFTVTKNGALLFTQTVPYHWWWARWRWQSATRPAVRTAAPLIALGKLLPHVSTYLYGWPGWTSTHYNTYTPMGTAGMDVITGDGGDRPELGPVTLPQADYIVNGTPLAWTTMIAMAEAQGTMPIHYRDENTGQWFDNQANPYYSLQGYGDPPLIPDPGNPPLIGGNYDLRYFYMNGSHAYPLTYVPYMFTDDPYYLEELQALALYHIIITNYHTSLQQLPGLIYPGETRSMAWGLREVSQCALVTPNPAPSWLNSQAHWVANLADNRTYLQRFQNSPALVHTRFRAFTRSNAIQGFENDYKMIVLAWMVRMGFSNWADGYTWAMGGIMPVVTGTDYTTGWEKGWPNPYYYELMTVDQGSITLIPDNSLDSITYTWPQAFQAYVNAQGNTSDPSLSSYPPPWDSVSIMQTPSNPGYFLYRQATLHLAQGLGYAGASDAVTWIDGQIPAQMARFPQTTSDPRWSFDTK
jgi:hypothetical protein